MVNPVRGEIELGGHTLRFTFNALCEAEAEMGKPITSLNWDAVMMADVRALLWAGLKGDKPDLTIEQAGALIQEIGIAECMDGLSRGMLAAFPETKSGNGKGAGR